MAAGAAVLGVEDLPPRCHMAGMVVPTGGSAEANPGTWFFSVERQGLPRSMTVGFKSKCSKRQEVEATHFLGIGPETSTVSLRPHSIDQSSPRAHPNARRRAMEPTSPWEDQF